MRVMISEPGRKFTKYSLKQQREDQSITNKVAWMKRVKLVTEVKYEQIYLPPVKNEPSGGSNVRAKGPSSQTVPSLCASGTVS